MHRSLILLSFLGCATTTSVGLANSRQEQRLFDGKSLAGWSGDPRYWRVENGLLVGESSAEEPLAETTYLIWQAGEVVDFELELEFRILGGNSGIQFRSQVVGPFAVSGYQADMEDGPNWTGGLYEQDGRGIVARRGQAVRLRAGGAEVSALADAAELLAAIHVQDWNRYKIRAVANQIDLWVNDLHTCRVIDEEESRALRGALALQLHAGPPMRVEYRALVLRALEPTLPPEVTTSTEETLPHWIWSGPRVVDHQETWLRKTFALSGKFVQAKLRGACDNRTNVYLNGELVAAGASWWSPFEQDVLEALRSGENVLAAWCQNESSTAGFWLELVVESEDGPSLCIQSDPSWLASAIEEPDFAAPDFVPSGWSAAHSMGQLGCPPWGTADTPTPFEPSNALAAEELELAAGFRAELLHSVVREKEGSWVALTADDRGGLYASDQYGALYHIQPPPIGHSAGTQVQRLRVPLGEAQGLLWAKNALYVVVNGHGKYESGLYRVRDNDGDGVLDKVEQLKAFGASGEHGPHAVRVGPDGDALYVIAGNFTPLPEPLNASRVPTVWGEDLLLPRIEDPNGHANGLLAPGAWLCRTDWEGKRWELVAAGMRNPYDFDFNAEGEAFAFDADMEWDVGLPWYRPTRVVHLVSGADYGWRNGSGKWPSYYPDSLPAVIDMGLGSPTGVAFGTQTNFPEPWRSALFVCDWSYGTLHAVHLTPVGASYSGESQIFARGKPFPLTDVCVGTDGALYLTTGGRQTQSGLYRITPSEPVERANSANPSASEGVEARELRRQLERWHRPEAPGLELKRCLEQLSNRDRFVRYAARVALEHQAAHLWQAQALGLADPLAGIEALVALARVGAPELAEPLLQRFKRLPNSLRSAPEYAAALRALELCLIRTGVPVAEAAPSLRRQLEVLYPSGVAEVDRELVLLLAWFESPELAERALLHCSLETRQEERIHALYALRVLAGSWSDELLERYFSLLDESSAGFAGGHSFALYLERIRDDAIARLLPEQQARWQAWHAERARSQAASTAAVAAPAVHVRDWTMAEVEAIAGARSSPPSAAAGWAAFEKATCHQCHRIGGRGGSTGPDLSSVASRFNLRDLLEAIVEPSKLVSDQYRDQELLTQDEELLVGRVEREHAGAIHLRLLPPSEELVLVPAAEVLLRRPHPLSRMPAALLNTLTETEIGELFCFLLAQTGSSASSGTTEKR